MTASGRIGDADRAGGPSDLSQSPLSQPEALIPCAAELLAEARIWLCSLRADFVSPTVLPDLDQFIDRIGKASWRTDEMPFDQRPIYQFVLLEGYQEHSGQIWHRRFAGTATIAKGGTSRFGYRSSDIDRIQCDGDMIVVERVLAWMPAAWPRWDFDAIAMETRRAETGTGSVAKP